jgi:hypothetical protein
LLGEKDCVSGVAGADIAFLAHEEEVEARMEDGDFSSVRGRGGRRPSEKSPQRVHTQREPSEVHALHTVHLVKEDGAVAGQAEVGGESNAAACVSACKKRALSGLSDGWRRPKRECPSSIFVGVRPYWSQDRLLYGFRLHYGDRNMKYGAYEDENEAALARHYAARQLARMTPSTLWPMNLEQFFLQSEVEKAKIDAWVFEWALPRLVGCDKPKYGVQLVVSSGSAGGAQFRVRYRMGRQRVDFGTFRDAELAALVSDYVSQEFFSKRALNYPGVQLSGHDDLKAELARIYAAAVCSEDVADADFGEAKRKFWNAVCEGPVFVCCCFHQTWFRKSVRAVTEDMVGSFAQDGCIAAITEVSSWFCRTCHSHLVCGRVPPVCHLHYDPFQGIPDELQGLSALENDLIALRIHL